MKNRVIWIAAILLVVSGLLIGAFGCAQPSTTVTPSATVAPSPKPTASPTPSPIAPTTTVAPTTAPTTAPPPAQQTVIKWKGQTLYPGAAAMGAIKYPPNFGMVAYWRDWVEQATGGRLVIDIAPPNTYFPGGQSFESIKQGMIDYCGVYFSLLNVGVMPEGDIEFGLPLAWQDGAMAYDALINRGMYQEFEKLYAQHNIKWFPNLTDSNYNIWTTFDPSKVDNLKGKKIRAVGVYGEYFKNLGASPTPIAAGEVHMGMKLGTIDGAIVGINSLREMQMGEVSKYYLYDPNPNACVSCMIINMNSWNKLPEDIKTILNRDTMAVQWGVAARQTRSAGELMKAEAQKAGIKIVNWTGEDKQRALDAAHASWDTIAAKSANCKKLVDMVKQQHKDWGML